MSAIARTKTGSPTNTPTQNRLDISTNSGLGPSSSVMVRGSSAIAHLGHAPTWSLTTSGCIGQTYSTFVTGTPITGSSPMPQIVQIAGWSARTSGCIGKVYPPADAAPAEVAPTTATGAMEPICTREGGDGETYFSGS